MLRPRVIPCLLLSNGSLVKTTKFSDPKYVGDPINAVRIFNEKEADELMVIDIDSTTNSTLPNFKLIERIAFECRMPLTYGGGVKTAEHVAEIVSLGVEKVAISSAAVNNLGLIRASSSEVGAQSVSVVLDVKANDSGQYEVYTHNGSIPTGRRVVDLAIDAQENGAGEVVVNSIDRDGLRNGYDFRLADQILKAVTIPVTILGGANTVEDFRKAVSQYGPIGLAAGSMFVFKGKFRAVLINYPSQDKRNLIFT